LVFSPTSVYVSGFGWRRLQPIKKNLQTYNCTDFAIEASQLAGINFRKTPGCWSENSCGVSPANLGQDMIEMKFTTTTPANRINFSSMTQANTGNGPCN
jgi:hypothetical protein